MTTDTWMTPVARERLEAELSELETANGTSSSAVKSRILELRELLRTADAASKPDDGLVEPGMTVTLRFERDGSTSTFLLGSREAIQRDPNLVVEVYSPTSPLGSAIAGHLVGESVSYLSPAGEQRVTILEATPYA